VLFISFCAMFNQLTAVLAGAILVLTVRADAQMIIDCTSDANCLDGADQVCGANITNVSPSCQTTICQCRPCFVYDSHVTSQCQPIVSLNVGDNCTSGTNELLPVGATCSSDSDTVVCPDYSNYQPNGNGSCSWKGLVPYGLTCSSSDDCADPTMQCSSDKCACDDGQMWDIGLNVCRRREYGDVCTQDDDCASVHSHDLDGGFTWSNGACVLGMCACDSAGTAVSLSYLDPATNQVLNKTICVNSNANFNATEGQGCDTRPIYNSDTGSSTYCALGLVCYNGCPEDSSAGYCRSVVQPFPAPVTPGACTGVTRRPTTTTPASM